MESQKDYCCNILAKILTKVLPKRICCSLFAKTRWKYAFPVRPKVISGIFRISQNIFTIFQKLRNFLKNLHFWVSSERLVTILKNDNPLCGLMGKSLYLYRRLRSNLNEPKKFCTFFSSFLLALFLLCWHYETKMNMDHIDILI